MTGWAEMYAAVMFAKKQNLMFVSLNDCLIITGVLQLLLLVYISVS